MESKTINKKALIRIIILLVVLIATIITLIILMVISTTFEFWEYIFYSGIAFFALMFSLVFLVEKIRNIKAGLPIRDEMQEKVIYKSGFLGFIAAMLSILVFAIVNPFSSDLTINIVLGLTFLVSCSVVLLSYLYQYRRGVTE